MAKATILVVLSVLCIVGTAVGSGYKSPGASATNFVKASCRATTYPALCVQTLSVYASAIQQSRRQMAVTALSVSVSRAQFAKAFVSRSLKFKGLKKREIQAIKDCIDEMGDSVDRLNKSVQELNHVGQAKGDDFLFHMSNVQTWVSAAVTDENTCLDGFAGRAMDGKLKSSIRAQVVNVAQVTSNALSLVNQFASRH